MFFNFFFLNVKFYANQMSNFMSIGCYLLFDPLTYFLLIILEYKNLKVKHLIDDIVKDFLSY